MKKMKLAAKISLGFGLLILIALALGGMAVFNMNNVAGESTKLAMEYVPEVAVATEIRGAANRTMYAMRGYGFTENTAFYEEAQKELKAMDEGLNQGKDLAKKASHLTQLGGALDTIDGSQNQYIKAVEQTKATIASLNELRGKLDTNAGSYMKASAEFLAGQSQAFERDLTERQEKIHLATQLVDTGSEVRVLNFKSQALRSPAMMEEAVQKLYGVKELSEKLRKVTREEDALKEIDIIVKSAEGYGMAMREFVSEFQKGAMADAGMLDSQRQAMDKNAGIYVTACDKFLDGQQKSLTRDMIERITKITLANDVVDLGNDTRISAYKSQALRDPAVMKEGQANFPKIDAKFEELRKITRLKEDLARIDTVQNAAKGYSAAMTEFLADWTKLQELGKVRDTLGNEMITATASLTAAGLDHTTAIARGAMDSLNSASTVMLGGLAVALILGVLLAVFITLSITRPINTVITGLTEGAGQVASAAGQVSTSSQSLAEGSAQQAAALEETSSSLEEMASMTRRNAENAGQANNLAQESGSVVNRANQAMSELIKAMEQISSAGEETGKIIKTIDEIAFQTNLLALNAAVEAARAGEAGAGFAVVADEVRNLAMRAAEAAKNTADLIEDTIKKTKEGSELVHRTNDAFAEVSETSTKVGELVGEIAAASQEQSQGIEQVTKAAGEMDKVTQQNAANAEESAAAAEELSAQAETMQGFVGDLVTLVGDATRKGGGVKGLLPRGKNGKAKGKLKALPGGTAHIKAKKAGQVSHHVAAAKVAPEKAIPFEEDEDFKDF